MIRARPRHQRSRAVFNWMYGKERSGTVPRGAHGD